MDPLTHLLTGWCLARGLPDRWRGGDGRVRAVGLWLPAAAVLAASLPDAVEALAGPDRRGDPINWLLTERGRSHGLIGATLSAAALWLAMLPTGRGDRRAGRWAAGFSAGRAAAVVATGVAAHLLWEAATPRGLRPLPPFSGAWVRGDLVLLGDPWVHLVLAAGVMLSLWREELGRWTVWALVAAFAGWCVARPAVEPAFTSRDPDELLPPAVVAGSWLVGLLHVAGLRRWRRWPRAPLVAGGLLAGWLAASAGFNHAARRAAVAELREMHDVRVAADAAAWARNPAAPDRTARLAELAGRWEPRPRAWSRPAGPVPWERDVLILHRPDRRLRPAAGGGPVAAGVEVRLARRRPGWSFGRDVRLDRGDDLDPGLPRAAGVAGDPRVAAWRAWCRFPAAAPTPPGPLTLRDVPFFPGHPWGGRAIFQIPLTPAAAAAIRPAWWPDPE